MDTLLLLARLVLAVPLAVAGVAKLADLAGSRRALEEFGVPKGAVWPVAILLPLAELTVAALLLPRATAWWAGLGALALLLLFVAGIGYNLSKGRRPDCHCFGQLHSEPAGWSTLVRNGVLVATAIFLIAGGTNEPGYSLVGWIGDLTTWETVATVVGLVALVAIVGEGWLLAHLLRQNGRVLLQLEAIEAPPSQAATPKPNQADPAPVQGLPEGAPAPTFRLEGLHGETVTLEALRAASKHVLLVFSDPSCRPCDALMPEISRWQREHASRLTVAVIGRGTADANRRKVAEHGLVNVLLQSDREVAQAYRTVGTPSAVLVRADGTIGSAIAAGSDAIRDLVIKTSKILTPLPTPVPATVRGDSAPPRPAAANGTVSVLPAPDAAAAAVAPPSPQIGDPAPEFSRPNLAGELVNLRDFRGLATVVLFWSPTCGHCVRMVNDLKAWDANPPADAPKLVIVSTGSAEANQGYGFASPLVLDEGFVVGRSFGASGTPSAVLIDANGKLASDVAVGSPSVLALLRGQDPKTAANGGAPVANEGDPVPDLTLTDLSGKTVTLAQSLREETVVLFWSPGCVHCQHMIDHLTAWEAEPPITAPNLLVISSGTAEANETLGLRAPILLDTEFAAGLAFGATGTPSAILIDERGRIGSKVAAGGNAVLALVGYVSPGCASCLEECNGRGGGGACQTVCQMGGQCP